MKEDRREIGAFGRGSLLSLIPDGFGVISATLVLSTPVAGALYAFAGDGPGPVQALAALALLAAIYGIYRWIVWMVDRYRNRLWLVERGVILRSWEQEQHRGGHVRTRHLPFCRVGHLTVGHPNCIRIHVGLESPVRINVSRFSLEDEADLFIEHFERYAPEHLLSIDNAGDHRYSRDWSIDELLADNDPVQTASVRSFGELRYAFDIGTTTYLFDEPNGVVRREGDGRAVLGVRGRRRILAGTGAVIAGAMRPKPNRIELRLGTGDRLSVSKTVGTVELNGTTIGQAQGGTTAEPHIDFATPVQPAFALLALIALVSRTGKLG